MKKKIFWLAGEKSGDLHAGGVIKHCRQKHPDWQHFGVGGKVMQAQGFLPKFEFSRFNVMGFWEVLKHISFFVNVEKQIARIFETEKPDAVVLVDYPGLNMRIARLAKKRGIPVLYYICPQFWAWKKKRIFQLRDFSDAIGYILPFEGKYFAEHQINATYTGHPISEEFSAQHNKDEMADELNIDPDKKWVSFFPGSRDSEIKKLLPAYLKAMQKLPDENYQFLLSRADTVNQKLFSQILERFPLRNLKIVEGLNYALMKHSDFLCVKSGTTTLETAYAGTPFIICYKTSLISYTLGRLLVDINWIGLPNIILQDSVIPELIQNNASPEAIASKIKYFLDHENAFSEMKTKLSKVHDLLEKKSASEEVTKLLEKLVTDGKKEVL